MTAMESLRDDPMLGVNVKASKMLALLNKLGYVQDQMLHPDMLVVHPQNRAGVMVNAWNVHQKGVLALKVGWSFKKLEESYCMEISHNPEKKRKVLADMERVVLASDGMLAPVSGNEKYQSLSASHMSQFCKAVSAGCVTQEEAVKSKVLALDVLQKDFPDEAFKTAVTAGWSWHCIASVVEESLPWFSNFLQGALNSCNHIAAKATEMELALHMSLTYKRTQSMDMALLECQSISNMHHIKLVAEFVKNYAGGADAPLIQMLVMLERTFNSSMMLGEEFMLAVVRTNFGSKESTFPICRAMLVAANLSSPKQQDGISKLLVKSDVLKLMGQKDQLLACEKMGKMLVEQNMASQDFHEPTAVKILGRFFIRAALYLTKKEGKGRETQIYGSLAKIHEQYMREQQKGMPSSSAAAVQVGTTTEKVVSLQDFAATYLVFSHALKSFKKGI